MKLATLFGQYLYEHKKLRLPGIGVFSIEPSLAVPDPSDKNFSEYLQNIRYTQQPVAAADEDLISFIRTQTGKIRPLAESDLDSYLSDGKILLNIGKPFQLQGIGSLQKNKAGNYDFTAGEPSGHRRDTSSIKDLSEDSGAPSVFTDDRSRDAGFRKLMLAALVITGLVLVIWGGYSLYNRNTADAPAATGVQDTSFRANSPAASSPTPDTSDTESTQSTSNSPVKAGFYKFIIERTSSKGRAYRRYNQLKNNVTDIRMEASKDSAWLSLYFILPARSADTARIKDSLRFWYGRKEVFIGR